MTTVSSCMMIELVMYGMIPSENTANRVERAAGEQVDELAARRRLAWLLQAAGAREVDVRHRDVRPEPEHAR